ncbi:MAG: tRNA (adenosine(37)-N6)-threonylcarbamoyltransferase complex transferase subunit TsaD [Deltaproteobacteria bacterium]|jgi:N6-L-threonylcarbamoyladenine synthase|nr:tRNA (adenosine(37)-N6)-threonylcarbamoyltransferase complex transferase subunit TsaD [Deltaproteobacteria bacterium]
MLVLGLESSCDETAAALVENGQVLGEVVRSQLDLHRLYGGVVPEIASRAHLEAIEVIVEQTFIEASLSLEQVEAVAVTLGPGLVGALLVALNFAKGLSMAASLPLTGVNHVQAHALAPFLFLPKHSPPPQPQFPLMALVASGGHTSLFLVKSYLDFTTIGRTVDDAAGEAFDKSAKLMGLGYPGGSKIERLASQGDPNSYKITRPLLNQGFDFSFSGLKTRVRTIYAEENMDDEPADSIKLKNLAASFQATAVEVLVSKLSAAAIKYKARGAILAGGVAANECLRRAMAQRFIELNLPLYIAPRRWCADNAAMIAYLGAYQIENNLGLLSLSAEARPRWPVENLS